MAIKQKYLVVWIIAVVVATFLAQHFLGCLASSLEHFVACGLASPAILSKFSAAFFGSWQL